MIVYRRCTHGDGLVILMLPLGQATAFIEGGRVQVWDNVGDDHGLTLHAAFTTTPELALGMARTHLRHRALGSLGSPRTWVPEG